MLLEAETPCWYLSATCQKQQGQVASTFTWKGESLVLIATKAPPFFEVRSIDLVATSPDDPIGFHHDDDDLSAEIAEVILCD